MLPVLGKCVGVFSDITDQIEREAILRDACDQAEEAARARPRFLANMSHEIRTPMGGVIGVTSLLLDSDLRDQDRDHVEVIRASGESLLSIINQILDFSKYEGGFVELESAPFELEQTVSEVLDVVASMAENKGLKLYLDMDPLPLAVVTGDSAKLRQVLINLLSNAVKFTNDGCVTVRVEPGTKQRDDAGATRLNVRIGIIDTGIGIQASALGRLFDPFIQEDASTTRKFGGTGLGLAISREIVLAMGGEMWVSSAPDEGSEFVFTLPLRCDALPALSTQACEPVASAMPRRLAAFGGQVTVDVVTDDQVLFNILVRQFARWGADARRIEPANALAAAAPNVLVDLSVCSLAGSPLTRHDMARPDQRVVGLAPISQLGTNPGIQLLRMPVRPGELFRALESPAERRAGEPSPVAAPSDVEAVTRLRVLLAEDNLVKQKVALQMMSRLDCDAVLLRTGGLRSNVPRGRFRCDFHGRADAGVGWPRRDPVDPGWHAVGTALHHCYDRECDGGRPRRVRGRRHERLCIEAGPHC